MGGNELIKAKRQEILRIAAKHGAYNVRIFGSVARGIADQQSDIDILDIVWRVVERDLPG